MHEAVKAIALCHNVTPVYEARAGAETESAEADRDFSDENRAYQASSPDEVSRPLEKHLTVAPCVFPRTRPRWGVDGDSSPCRVWRPRERTVAAAALSSGLRVPRGQQPAVPGAVSTAASRGCFLSPDEPSASHATFPVTSAGAWMRGACLRAGLGWR